MKWWNPVTEGYRPQGQGWPGELAHPYDRLPARAQQNVREVVWFKSQQSTGLVINFKTDASYIHVRYKVKDTLFFEHMPATGVSGLDLYALDQKGKWHWTGADYIYSDTISYFYNDLSPDNSRTYYLYLPLYNRLEWLEIGVAETAQFTPLPWDNKGSVVIYGTSITQGGCASRPGMAWTALLGRKLQRPVVNIGFSSNGQLEQPLADLITELNASIFILDCFPNMSSGFSEEEITNRLFATIKTIRAKHPHTPIIVAEHGDAAINSLNTELDGRFKKVNEIAVRAFKKLKSASFKGIYFLSAKEIGLDNDCTVDGQHPNDLGMERYASAYERIIRKKGIK
jgi:lysophospholipase L1-like esterase